MALGTTKDREKYKGVGTTFPIRFPVLDKSNIVVYKNGSALTLTTDYTINTEATAITLTTATESTDTIEIIEEMPLTQTHNLYNATNDLKTSPSEVSTAIDKVYRVYQQLNAEFDSQIGVTNAVFANLANTTLPEAAGEYLRFNSAGTAITTMGVSGAGVAEVSEDTSPTLGGDLNVSSYEITTTTTNGDIIFKPNGSGDLSLKGNSTQGGKLKLGENTGNGTNYVQLAAPSSIATSFTLVLPSELPSGEGISLTTNGSGTLSYSSVDPDRVLVDDEIAVSATSLNLGLSGAFDRYEIEFSCNMSKAEGSLLVQTGNEGEGGSYDSGASDYRYTYLLSDSSGTQTSGGDDAHSSIYLGAAATDPTGEPFVGKLCVHNPKNSGAYTVLSWEARAHGDVSGTPTVHRVHGMGSRLESSFVDTLQFLPTTGISVPSAGTNKIDGTFKCYGVGPILPQYSLDFEHSTDAGLEMSATNYGLSSMSSKKIGVSFWFKLDDVAPEASQWAFFGISDSDASTPVRRLLISNNPNQAETADEIKVVIGLESESNVSVTTSSSPITTGTWKHCYVKIDTTKENADDRVQVYINGTLETLTSKTGGTRDDIVQDAEFQETGMTLVRIGGSTTDAWDMDGHIYQLAVFSHDTYELPSIHDLYDSTNSAAKGVAHLKGLHSLLWDVGVNSTSATVTTDFKLSTAWSTNGTTFSSGPSADADIPTII